MRRLVVVSKSCKSIDMMNHRLLCFNMQVRSHLCCPKTPRRWKSDKMNTKKASSYRLALDSSRRDKSQVSNRVGREGKRAQLARLSRMQAVALRNQNRCLRMKKAKIRDNFQWKRQLNFTRSYNRHLMKSRLTETIL